MGEKAENRDDAMKTMDIMLSDEALQVYSEINQVISPSKNANIIALLLSNINCLSSQTVI